MKLKPAVSNKTVWRKIAGMVLMLSLVIPGGIAWAQSVMTIETFAILPVDSLPGAIVYGPDQSYWLPQLQGNAITKFQEPDSQTQIDLVQENSVPYDAVVGPDKDVWFTENQIASLGKIHVNEGTPITEVTHTVLPDATSDPSQIMFGHEGNVWFTEFNAGRIGHTNINGEIQEIGLAANSRPMGITNDEQGNIWFTEWGARKLGKITRQGELIEFPIPNAVFRPTEIIRDQDGYLWVLLDSLNRILRVDINTDQITEFIIDSALSSSFVDIAVGVDGKIWLLGTESIGWLVNTIDGPANYEEMEIDPKIFEGEGRAQLMAGPDSNMVFTNNNNSTVYQVQLADSGLRDLQIYGTNKPPLVLAAGKFYIDLEMINWSRQDANDVSLTLELDENIAFVEIQGYPVEDCAVDADKATCEIGTIPASSSLEITVTYKTSRIQGYNVARNLAFTVDLAAGDYLPTNNRLTRPIQIQESIDYFNDFSVGAEAEYWNHTQVTPSANATQTLGRFSNDNVALTFNDLPPHDEIDICFQLYVMGAWDGNQFQDPDVTVEPFRSLVRISGQIISMIPGW